MDADIVILAGGNSSRMASNRPKFLLEIANKPMISHIIEKYKLLNFKNIHVVTPPKYSSETVLSNVHVVVQQIANGNANALLLTLHYLQCDYTIVQYADMPLITTKEISNLFNNKYNDLTFIAGILPNDLLSKPYGRVFLDENNHFDKLVEYRDLTIAQRNQSLFNTGFYMFKTDVLREYINDIPYHTGANERYITDILEILKNNNKKIEVIVSDNYQNFQGVNTPEELAVVDNIMKNRLYNNKYYKVS
ncbi:MAG: NTP transferase domain-containing protein [Alphaproteobacteria bacterium]|nr:NTP transferase domain-containing protein [Alphaproteobacteria bacterium]